MVKKLSWPDRFSFNSKGSPVLIQPCSRISHFGSDMVICLFSGVFLPRLLLSCVTESQCPRITYTLSSQPSATQERRFPKQTFSPSFSISRWYWWHSALLYATFSLKCWRKDWILLMFSSIVWTRLHLVVDLSALSVEPWSLTSPRKRWVPHQLSHARPPNLSHRSILLY